MSDEAFFEELKKPYRGAYRGRAGRIAEARREIFRADADLIGSLVANIRYVKQGHMLSQRRMMLDCVTMLRRLRSA